MPVSPALQLVLYQPEIPPNTGNIIRLAANTGVPLHLVRPLGFSIDHRALRRAGLDYRDFAELSVHDSLEQYLVTAGRQRLVAFSTRAGTCLWQAAFRAGDALLFGPETRGLPPALMARCDLCLRIPMLPGSRSLNLSNAVAVATYEAWRQLQGAA